MHGVRSRPRWLAAPLAALAVLSGLAACGGRVQTLATRPPVIRSGPLGFQPNIVFVLTDDLSWNLVRHMPHVRALQNAGVTFTNFTTTDSLCCPSRSSIFTGDFPHDTKVFTNTGADGGFHIFHQRGEESHTFATALQKVGYRTALIGKYLNGYKPGTAFDPLGQPVVGAPTWVPPGWSYWAGTGAAYQGFDYALNETHKLVFYGRAPGDYTTTVFGRLAERFISTAADDRVPFLLEVSTFAPHKPYTPAPRDRKLFPHLRAPRTPAWNRLPDHAPPWLANRHRLSPKEVHEIDDAYRQRVRSVQAVDRMVGRLQQQLVRTGQAQRTVFVFSSDNGLHLGEHTLDPGKLTAFDSDIEVPLIVAGPGIPAGLTDPAVVQNIDLAPSFEDLGGARVPGGVDGRSMVPLLVGRTPPPWRTAALVEHHGLDFAQGDPDVQNLGAGNPPTYAALRTVRFTYVRYANSQREYYDRLRDPFELDNAYGQLSPERVRQLNRRLDLLTACHGGSACWRAGAPVG